MNSKDYVRISRAIEHTERKLNLFVDQCEVIEREIEKEEYRLQLYTDNKMYKTLAQMRILTLRGVYDAYFNTAHRTGDILRSLHKRLQEVCKASSEIR